MVIGISQDGSEGQVGVARIDEGYLIPHIYEKKYAKEMYDALLSLYQKRNIGRFLHLKHQIQVVKISSEDMVVNYLMNIT
jgi:hypothetical protein